MICNLHIRLVRVLTAPFVSGGGLCAFLYDNRTNTALNNPVATKRSGCGFAMSCFMHLHFLSQVCCCRA